LLSSFTALDMNSFDTGELPTIVLTMEKLVNAVNALSAAILDKFQREGEWAVDGALSAAVWTAERTGASRAHLRGAYGRERR
jgi:hypothetical protein